MICLGPQNLTTQEFDAQAAQLRIFESFRTHFLGRFPDGEVTSELEYQGGTTSPFTLPRPPRTFGRHHVDRVYAALAADFRNWSKERDYRKCDVLGIANDGVTAELIEVTIDYNAASAIRQLEHKLSILRQTVNRNHNLHVDWRAAPWRPNTKRLFCPLRAPSGQMRYACYEPTVRNSAPNGIVLYEIHALDRSVATEPLPQNVRDAVRKHADSSRHQTPEAWAQNVTAREPGVSGTLRVLAIGGAIALIVIGIAMLLDPVPGNEVLAFTAAMALVRVSQGS